MGSAGPCRATRQRRNPIRSHSAHSLLRLCVARYTVRQCPQCHRPFALVNALPQISRRIAHPSPHSFAPQHGMPVAVVGQWLSRSKTDKVLSRTLTVAAPPQTPTPMIRLDTVRAKRCPPAVIDHCSSHAAALLPSGRTGALRSPPALVRPQSVGRCSPHVPRQSHRKHCAPRTERIGSRRCALLCCTVLCCAGSWLDPHAHAARVLRRQCVCAQLQPTLSIFSRCSLSRSAVVARLAGHR